MSKLAQFASPIVVLWQASMPIRHGSNLAKKRRTSPRRSFVEAALALAVDGHAPGIRSRDIRPNVKVVMTDSGVGVPTVFL